MKNKQLLTAGAIIVVLVALFFIRNSALFQGDEVDFTDTENQIVVPDQEDIPEPEVATNSEAPTAQPTQQRPDHSQLTQAEFKRQLGQYLASIPLQKEMHKKSIGQVHHIPMELIEMGRKLGTIKEILAQRPDLIDSGIAFYSLCSQKEGALTSIRALCLSNLIHFSRQKGQDVDLDKYPDNVRQMAQEALDLY